MYICTNHNNQMQEISANMILAPWFMVFHFSMSFLILTSYLLRNERNLILKLNTEKELKIKLRKYLSPFSNNNYKK